MQAEDLRVDIENNFAIRQAEILFYQNQIELATVAADRDKMRRAIVLLLYAHFEGFTKLALSLYVAAINSLRLRCADASATLVAATLSDVFRELRAPQPVSGLFRGQSPDDSKLMRFARERQFVESAYDWLEREVTLADSLVDTESNLKPPVLRKLMYRLGFDATALSAEDGKIEELVNRRNDIAHGTDISGVREEQYLSLRDSTFRAMSAIARLIVGSIENERYKRV